MTQEAPSRSFIGYLTIPLVMKVVERKLLRGPVIRFSDFMQITSYLYECMALLGRAKRGVLPILVKILAAEGKEQDYIDYFQGLARDRLATYHSLSAGKEPSSFFTLFYTTEFAKGGLVLGDPSHLKKMTKALREKGRLATLEPLMNALTNEGVGFGSAFPDLTEKLYRNSREGITENDFNELRQHWTDLPENPTIVGFEEQEDIVLSMTASYVADYFPHLLEPLGLTEQPPIDWN